MTNTQTHLTYTGTKKVPAGLQENSLVMETTAIRVKNSTGISGSCLNLQYEERIQRLSI